MARNATAESVMPKVHAMFRHRERFVKYMIFFLAGVMALSLTLPFLAALLDG